MMDGLMRDLHIVSKLQIKNKLASDRSGLYIDNNTWVSPVMRWMRQDSRQQTIADLNKLLLRLREKQTDIGQLPEGLLTIIPQAANGISNLISTYADDPCLVSELEIIHNKLLELVQVSAAFKDSKTKPPQKAVQH